MGWGEAGARDGWENVLKDMERGKLDEKMDWGELDKERNSKIDLEGKKKREIWLREG